MSTERRASVKLATLFIVLAGIPLVALGWLGGRLLEQDQALETQRRRERLENAADLLTRELDRSLAAWEALLPSAAQGAAVELPPSGVILVFDSRGVVRHQGIPLPFYPLVSPSPDVPGDLFAVGEVQEFQQEDLGSAAATYRGLAAAHDGPVRASALARLARAHRKQGRLADALAVYEKLAGMGETPVMGSPAALLARHERLAVLRMTDDEEAAAREAAALGAALWEGGMTIDRATFEFYRLSVAAEPAVNTLALADAIEGLWPRWHQQATGRAAWPADGRELVSAWRRTATHTAAIVVGADDLLASAADVTRRLEARFSLEDRAGRLVWGVPPADATPPVRTLREIGLPWTLRVVAADPAGLEAVAAGRRNLLLAGFAFMVLVVTAASVFVYRALSRELAVARLQSDFVAAVSHEFRTPLTAMRHLTEILEEGGAPGDRLPRYYRALAKETRRLHGMVESLLDFGRMEAGQRTYQMEDISAADVARRVVDEFREQVSDAAHRVAFEAPLDEQGDQGRADGPRIRADREALALALRNLLDNAVKYSPESSTVSVAVGSRDGFANLSVTDHGSGIPRAEQRHVFRKFVRGTTAATLHVKGTGIGLALADHIVRAHGGRIELTSDEGHGSRFAILMPMLREHAEAVALAPRSVS